MARLSETEAAAGPDVESRLPEVTASRLDARGAREVWTDVTALALKQLDRLIALEPKVLRDESTEPVHDLRVASRRLQALVDFLYPAPAPGAIRKLRRRLKKVRSTLGELRNQDVMASRIERALARKRTAHRSAWEAARDYVHKLRPKTAKRAHRKLTKLNLADLYVRLRQELSDHQPSEPPEPPLVIAFPDERAANKGPVAEVAPEPGGETSAEVHLASLFAMQLGDLWRDFEAKTAESREDRKALHALRIAAKRLRYLVEVAAELKVKGSKEALAWLRALQGKLGDWHDFEVLSGTLLEMVAHRSFLEEHLQLAVEVEKLVLRLRRSKTATCERYLRRTFRSPDYRRTAEWMSQWVASSPLPTA